MPKKIVFQFKIIYKSTPLNDLLMNIILFNLLNDNIQFKIKEKKT